MVNSGILLACFKIERCGIGVWRARVNNNTAAHWGALPLLWIQVAHTRPPNPVFNNRLEARSGLHFWFAGRQRTFIVRTRI